MWRFVRWIVVSLSVLLLAGTVAGWVRAQFAGEGVSYRLWNGSSPQAQTRVVMLFGYRQSLAIHLISMTFQTNDPGESAELMRDLAGEARFRRDVWPAAVWENADSSIIDKHRGWQFGGFGWDAASWKWKSGTPTGWGYQLGPRDYLNGARSHQSLVLPWWFLAMVFSLAPARAFWKWKRGRRRPAHACPSCGYDLRATPDASGPLLARCPECGRGR